MISTSGSWMPVCSIDDIVPETGVAAVFGSTQIAVFLYGDVPYAVGNRDPVSGAGVIARGILGDHKGVPKITSPLYKQSYFLKTGECVDDASVKLSTYRARLKGGMVEVYMEAT